MMKLETFLFGCLDSPVEFGKEDDEELRGGVDKSSALFFTEKSANSVLSVYEDDAEFRESSDDADEAGQRKPVWVDDEEEKGQLRKLRKEEDESVISGSAHVSRLRAHHVKLNPGTEWAQRDSQPRNCSSDDEDSDIENGVVLARGCKDVEGFRSSESYGKIGPLTGREEKSLEVFEVLPDSNTIVFVGNEGYILLVSSKTKELVGTLKMNGTA
ncbi:hypothetical protein HYC85_021866 [Camellia sinensis]|uniref:Uncharacterized protein n=1 Tax=Camellia sinensis TaxID=4442 RepID=A0A7J7GIR7_CAMSI|nr:hypothetical protein HYC85_021866 [Camellia sinensis]